MECIIESYHGQESAWTVDGLGGRLFEWRQDTDRGVVLGKRETWKREPRLFCSVGGPGRDVIADTLSGSNSMSCVERYRSLHLVNN